MISEEIVDVLVLSFFDLVNFDLSFEIEILLKLVESRLILLNQINDLEVIVLLSRSSNLVKLILFLLNLLDHTVGLILDLTLL